MTKINSATGLAKLMKGKMKKKKGERKISHMEFLMSNSFRYDLQKFLRAITGNYTNTLVFDFENGRNCTDGKVVTISPLREELEPFNLTLKQKVSLIRETTAHEGFHILYTDFKVLDFLNAKYKDNPRRRNILFHYFNILEDGAINLAGLHKFPGLIPYFKMCYDLYSSIMVPEEIEKTSKLNAHQRAVLYYALYKGDHSVTFADEKLQEVYEQCKPIVMKAIVAETSQKRYEYAEQIFKMMEPFIEEVENGNDEYNEGEFDVHIVPNDGSSDGQSKPMKMPPEAVEALKKELEKRKEELEKQQNDSNGEGMEMDMDGDGEQQEGDSEDKENSSSSKKGKEGEEEENQEKPNPSSDSEKSDSEEEGEGDQGDSDDADAKLDEFLEEFNRKLEADIKSLEKKVEKELDEKEQQEQREEAMRKQMASTKYDVRHKDIKITHRHMNKSIDSNTKNRYRKQYEAVKNVIRSMTKHLEKMIQYNRDEKHTGEYRGRLNAGQLWRKDGKIFYNRTEKTQESDLAIVLLVDQSGSMSYARRIENARLGSIMVAEVCQNMNIPLAVMGHTSQFHDPEMRLQHYISFERDIDSQKESLAKMESLNDNRDGLALHYALEYLHQQPQRDKILLVINDGLPAHGYDNYYGESTIVDCNNVIKKYEKEGIATIGVAIGDGKDEIAKIYKNYISVENLTMLPKKLASIIERNIFKQN